MSFGDLIENDFGVKNKFVIDETLEGADPRTTDSNGNTVLHTAASYGHYHLIEIFLNDGSADLLRLTMWFCNSCVILKIKYLELILIINVDNL